MGSACLIILSTLTLESRYFNKRLRLIILAVMLLAILMTRSRAGVGSLGIALFLMCIFGKQKRYAWTFATLGMITLIALPMVRSLLFARFVEVGMTVGFWETLGQRYVAAVSLWKDVTLSRVLFGRSHYAVSLLGHQRPHDFYLGTTLTYGIGGVIWVIWLAVTTLRKAKGMKNYPDLRISGFGSAIRWCFLTYALFGISTELIENTFVIYTIFLLTIFAQLGQEFINQYEPLHEGEMSEYDVMFLETGESW